MRTALLSLFVTVLINIQSATAYPYYENSSLQIKSTGSGLITVSIDKNYFSEPTNRFSIDNVSPGNHYIEIFTDRIIHTGYSVSHQRSKLFAGNVYIAAASIIKGVVDNSGRFYIKDVNPIQQTNAYDYYDPYQQYQPYSPYEQQYACAPSAINSQSFYQLMDVLKDQWYDDSKLAVAVQALQSNWFTSEQVKQMMHEFWYEETKLKLAKAAYGHVIDAQNYYLVNKEFWYSSSVEELSNYINTFRH